MKFKNAKFTAEQRDQLRKVPSYLFQPFTVMASPVYLYLSLNRKFVAIKAPGSVFNPTELQRYRVFKNFFVLPFVDRVVPFQRAGVAVRRILLSSHRESIKSNLGKVPVLLPAPHDQVSRAALSVTATLWGSDLRVQPFFLSFFANEVCEPLSPQRIEKAIEKDVRNFELGLTRSGLVVFLAIHIGLIDLPSVNRLRDHVFDSAVGEAEGGFASDLSRVESELVELCQELLPDPDQIEISMLDFVEKKGAIASKIRSRLGRIRTGLIPVDAPSATAVGEGGIADVA